MTGGGVFYQLTPGFTGPLSRRLALPEPLNGTEFDRGVSDDVNRDWFRSHDVIARAAVAGWQLFVTHHMWNAAEKCFTTVSKIELGAALKIATDAG